MLNHLEKIRQKPKRIRKKVAVFVTFVIFLFIVFLWATTFTASFSIDGKKEESRTKKENSPIEVIKKTFNGAVQDVGGKYKERFGNGDKTEDVIK